MSRKIPKPDTLQINKYQNALTFLADPDRQVQGGFGNGSKSNILINYAANGATADKENLVPSRTNLVNLTFRDIRGDGTVGELDPFYVSDFSSEIDGWKVNRAAVSASETEPSTGETDVLKFWANDEEGTHNIYRSIVLKRNQKIRVTGKFYVPSSNSNVKGFGILLQGNGNNGRYQDFTLDQWVEFDIEFVNRYAYVDPSSTSLNIYGIISDGSYSFVGANDSNNDIVYVKDIKIQRLGPVAHWVFDEMYNKQGELIYESNFYGGTDDWHSYNGSIVQVNNEIDGYRHVLKVQANTTNPTALDYHGTYKRSFLRPHATYRIKGKIYIPSTNTNLAQVDIVCSWPNADYNISKQDEWADFDFTIKVDSNSNWPIRFRALDASGSNHFAGTGVDNDDIFYVRDIVVYSIGGGYIGEDWAKGGADYSNVSSLSKYNASPHNYTSDYSYGDFSIDGSTVYNLSDVPTTWMQMANNIISGPIDPNIKLFRLRFRQRVDSDYSGVDRVLVRICLDDENSYADKSLYYVDGWKTASYHGSYQDYTVDNTDGKLFDIIFKFNNLPSNAKYLSISIGSDHGVGGKKYYLHDIKIEQISNGHHLLFSDGFDYKNQMTKKSIVYSGGKTVEFDGTNDYFKTDDNTKLAEMFQEKSFTVLAWVWFNDSSTGDQPLLSIGAPDIDQLLHIVRRDNKPFMGFYGDDLHGETILTPNKWWFLIFVWDALIKEQRIYVNGILDAHKASNILNVPNGHPLRIGANRNYSYLNGSIAELALVNYAATENDLLMLTMQHNCSLRASSNGDYGFIKGYISPVGQSSIKYQRIFIDIDSSINWALQIESLKVPVNNTIMTTIEYKTNNELYLRDGWGPAISLPTVQDSFKKQSILFANMNGSIDTILLNPSSNSPGAYLDTKNITIKDMTFPTPYNHGRCYGDLHKAGWGIHPAAIQLDGVNDHIDYGPINAVGANPFLFFGWLKTNATSGTIISRRYNTDTWYLVQLHDSNGKLRVELSYDYANRNTTGHYYNYYSDNPVNDGVWHSYAVARDNNGDIYLFVDKTKQTAEYPFPETLDSPDSNDVQFKIGAWGANNYDPFSGLIGIHVGLVFNTDTLKELATFENLSELVNNFHDQTQHKYLGG